MPATDLTEAEARERAALLEVRSYDVSLDLSGAGDTERRTYPSTTLVRFAARTPGAATFADLIAPAVREISLNGRTLDPASASTAGRIVLEDLAAENELRVVADCEYLNTGEGLHRMIDPVDGQAYLYTQFEAADARRVFTVFDQPDLKAVFRFSVTAPSGWTVLSNAPSPAPEPAARGVSTWAFASTARISPYITAIVAGPYHVECAAHTTKRGQAIPLRVAVRRSLAEHLKPEEIFEVTRAGLDFFTELFDRDYPFAKYDQVFIPEFAAGGMENAGCVTIQEEMVFRGRATAAEYRQRDEIVLHEIAHMWFGDLVTMRWWNDLWLNESFATYSAYLAMSETAERHDAWTAFANGLKTWGYRQDQLASTHPIVTEVPSVEQVWANFDGITYAKGAAVLRQLVAWVGHDRFIEGVRRYFAQHAWGNATLADLLAALEAASGRDLGEWSAQWLATSGPNTLRPVYEVDDVGRFTAFAVAQEGYSSRHPTLRAHRLAIGLYELAHGRLLRTRRIEVDVAGAVTEVPELHGVPRPDLVLVNDDDLTYARIRLDPHSAATLVEHSGAFTAPLPRALCWGAAWDMLQSAELAARGYLRLVLGGIGGESDIGVCQLLQRQAKTAVELFADPAWRPTGQALLCAAAREHLLAAAPGSDLQLAWARTFAGAACTGEHLAFVAGLLDGTRSVPGLAVDTELRWALLLALVADGRADLARIEEELRRDPTAAGERHALRARAARPTAEAKAEAWASIVAGGELAAQSAAALVEGFQTAPADRREELLRPYAAQYFTAAAGFWETRTPDTAAALAAGLFPAGVIEQATLDAAAGFLAEEHGTPTLRRTVLERADAVRRALAGQAADRAGAGSSAS